MAKGASTSANRRTDIVSAAIEVFAEIGYYRATTAQVADKAAISQPYVYRFFASKEALLLEALEVSWQRIVHAFEGVRDSAAPEQLEKGFIAAYEEIIQSHRSEILLQMQAQTIREEPIRESMQRGMQQVRQLVLDAFREAGIEAPESRTSDFLARGMLCNVAMALDLYDELMVKQR
ncbi:TetR/AcrR family transcriptional regulator [Paenibacillus sp. TAB 01]|uniref:TetR/AcrR family transcriptional regulator n=1 Tax=Paenibacillus sp. TAB 01 TaxID=3368988 RepID=UPI003750D6EB